jgi:hypothetical protein
MKTRWRCFVTAFVFVLAGYRACNAQVLVYPNGQQVPGELAGPLSGSSIALVSGPESAWINPAGLAADPGRAATAGADLLRYSTTTVDGRAVSGFEPGPAFASFSWGGAKRGDSGWGAAIALNWPETTRHATATRSAESLPFDSIPARIDPGGLNVFEEGISSRRTTQGLGEYRVLSTVFAAAYGPSDWFRFGFGLEWQRIDYLAQASALTTYHAETGDDPHQTYRAHVFSESRFEGQEDRVVPILGLQLRPIRGLVFGIQARLPSRFQGGNGSVRWSQSSSATLDAGESPADTVTELLTAERAGQEFDLRSPLEVGVGIGLAGSSTSMELDISRSFGQPRYTVLEVPESAPPSTAVFEPQAFRTGSNTVTHWRMGFTLAVNDSTAWMVGVRDDRAEVPADDPVFRRFDLSTVSTAWAIQRGSASVSLGLLYQSSLPQRVSLPSPLGDTRGEEKVDFQSFGFRVSGTWLL